MKLTERTTRVAVRARARGGQPERRGSFAFDFPASFSSSQVHVVARSFFPNVFGGGATHLHAPHASRYGSRAGPQIRKFQCANA